MAERSGAVDKWSLMEAFDRYWGKRERGGQVSSLGFLEWMAVEIFAEWLLKRYEVVKK